MIQEQLLLSLQPHTLATFENFVVPDETKNLVQLLKTFLSNEGEKYIFLSGAAGVGKTHLAQACSHEVIARGGKAMVLDGNTLVDYPPKTLRGIEALDLVCIDNIERLLGLPAWEEALFHCYNRMQQTPVRLLITASHPPRYLEIQLPDLKSRLMQGLVLHVEGLSDAQKAAVLQHRAAQRGMRLTNTVAEFIVHRVTRNMSNIQSVLDTLDNASMVAQRRITVPFVKQTLEI